MAESKLTAEMAVEQEILDGLQRFYGGTPTEAVQKFMESQLCKQVTVVKVLSVEYILTNNIQDETPCEEVPIDLPPEKSQPSLNQIVTLGLSILPGIIMTVIGGYLCYEGKEGWGWFLFVAFIYFSWVREKLL